MYQLPCSLCRDQIECKGGELAQLKKHIKSEHDIVKYKVDLVLALSCIGPDEEKRLIEGVQVRLERFQATGEMVMDGSIFEGQAEKETILPGRTEIKSMKKDVEAIQKMIADDISDDEVENEQFCKKSRNIGDEILLLEDSLLTNLVDETMSSDNSNDDDVIEILFDNNVGSTKSLDINKAIKEETKEASFEDQPTEMFVSPIEKDDTMEALLSKVDCKMEVDDNEIIPLDAETFEELEAPNNSAPFCRLCYVTFSSQTEQLPHEQTVHNSTEDREALKVDVTQLTLKDFTHVCDICSSKFRTKNSVIHHKKKEHRVGVNKTTICNTCRKVIKTSKLRLHMRSHSERKFRCKLCYKGFTRNKYLVSHENIIHKNETELLSTEITEEDLKHNCNRCELKFITEQLLDRHTKEHQEKQPLPMKECRLCYKEFKTSKELKLHEKTVHKNDFEYLGRNILDSELLYKCSNCDKRFVKESISLIHQKRHDLEKFEFLRAESCISDEASPRRFECKFCYKKHDKFSVLLSHIQLHHKTDIHRIGEKIITLDLAYFCKACDLGFISEPILTYHNKRIHKSSTNTSVTKSVQPTEECKHCPQKFTHHSSLRRHYKANHNLDMPRRNQITVHNKEPSSCRLCHVLFESHKKCTEHIRDTHKRFKDEMMAIEALRGETEIVLTSKCKFCHKGLLNRHVLSYHYDKVHREQEHKKVWKCEFCKKEFKPDLHVRTNRLKQHMREDHDLEDYHIAEAKGALKIQGNKAKQNYQLMLAKIMGKQ